MSASTSSMPLSPQIPPFLTADLPGTGGTIGGSPDDFVVDEVPLYAPSGTGDHVYVRLRKRGRTTQDALVAISRAAGVPQHAIGSAGMKDKHAVTTQWISLPAHGLTPPDTWELPEGYEILEVSRHNNKLRTGHLSGNRFAIRITGASDDAETRARAILGRIAGHGLPNYFGMQRFGRGGNNVQSAFDWLNSERAGGRSRFDKKLLPSVIQSEHFNRYVPLRLQEGLERPLLGEVVRLSGSGSSFVVEDVEKEMPRWSTRDILPTGPMVGPKMRAARDRVLELERSAAESLGLDEELLGRLGRFADGTRRDLLVWPEECSVESEAPGTLVVRFGLPSGSYATVLIRELTRIADA